MPTHAPFDTLTFVQRLERVGVGRQIAEAHAELTRDVVLSEVVTRTELEKQIARVEQRLSQLEERLSARIERQEHVMTIKFGAMLAAAAGVVVAAQKLL